MIVLLLGVLLFTGSCVPLGYSIYLNLLSGPSQSYPLEINVPASLDAVMLLPESYARLAVKGEIETRSVQEEDHESDLTYVARYKFPVTYTVTDHTGRIIDKRQTEINWDTGSRITSSNEVDSHGGQLEVRHNFEKFSVPASGQVNLEFLIGPDDLYDARIITPRLQVFDGLVNDSWYIGGGMLMLITAIVLMITGFVFILSTYTTANTATTVDDKIPETSFDGNIVNSRHEGHVKATWIHLAGFAGYIVPFCSVILPVILWLLWKEEDVFIDDQGREAVNFQLSVLVYIIICIPLLIILIGFILLIMTGIFHIVLMIVAALRSSQGIPFRYPLIIRFIKQ